MYHTKQELTAVFAPMLLIPSSCEDGLFQALSQIYSDQESSSVLHLTQKVAAAFARGNRFADGVELGELKQLRADAQASLSLACCRGNAAVAMSPGVQVVINTSRPLQGASRFFLAMS